MRTTAKTASFVERLTELKMVVGGRDPDVDVLLTELTLGAQAVDHIKKRAVMTLEQDTSGTYWHDREQREILRLAESHGWVRQSD